MSKANLNDMTTEQILKSYKFSHKFLTLFAIATAKYAMSFIKKPDIRLVKAISVAEAFINGKATRKELEEAADAAVNAAHAAAYAAYATANAAAYAAYATANAAAHAAAYAANAAAYAATYVAANAAYAAYAANAAAHAAAYAGDKAYKKAHAKAQDHVRNILLSMIKELTELERFMLDIPKGLK